MTKILIDEDKLKLVLQALELEEAQTHYPPQWLLRAITVIKEALAQTQEPDDIASILACRDMLDAQPVPPRTWVGLTDDEKNDCLVSADPCEALAEPEARQLIEDVEQALKERNQ